MFRSSVGHAFAKACPRDRLLKGDAVSTIQTVQLPPAVRAAVDASPNVIIPASREDLYRLSLGPYGGPEHQVAYDVEGRTVVEATVTRCRNGVAVNFLEDYMRRRDPRCMVIADDRPTNKTRWADRFDGSFAPVRNETLEWLSQQPLVVVPFRAGGPVHGSPSLAVVPANAAFFALALVDLQGWVM